VTRYLAFNWRPSVPAALCALESGSRSLSAAGGVDAVHRERILVAAVATGTGGKPAGTGRGVNQVPGQAVFGASPRQIHMNRQQTRSAVTSGLAAKNELTGKPVARGVPPRGRPV
jgi:hypothetical protein